jgi:phospholipid/cholesterol/gamma-HCH transport system substrate-binding protein
MEERNKKTELLVGLFLTFGLLLLGLLILQFSSVRELFKDTYDITGAFPDGSGIKKGTPVRLGGLPAGKVPKPPAPNSSFDGVIITLEIYEHVKIPADALFGIGTSGLLGDSYIEIKPSGKPPQAYIEPGAALGKEYNSKGGLGGLQETAAEVAEKLAVAVDAITDVVADVKLSLKRINEGALSEKTTVEFRDTLTLGEQTSKDVREAVASFKNAAKSLEETTKKLDPAVTKLDSAFGKADAVMVSANDAMKSIDDSADAIGKVARDLNKSGGLLPALIHDASLKHEFSQLISNLRQRGILFYKDKPGAEEQAPTPLRRPQTGGSKR